jgi:HEAT repeat protein
MTYFCPECWREIGGDGICAHCGADLTKEAQSTYEEKLIQALWHPEPTTPIRAATLLGEIGSKVAIEPLLELVNSSRDPYIQEAAVVALGKIGDRRALPYLERWRAQGSVRVRLAAEQAIRSIGQEKSENLSQTERCSK